MFECLKLWRETHELTMKPLWLLVILDPNRGCNLDSSGNFTLDFTLCISFSKYYKGKKISHSFTDLFYENSSLYAFPKKRWLWSFLPFGGSRKCDKDNIVASEVPLVELAMRHPVRT